MAIAIKSIPTLTEKVAQTFIRKADAATKKEVLWIFQSKFHLRIRYWKKQK
jgi:hypothetical protein